MERSTIFNGKIHYKSPFSIAMLNYQRVAPGTQMLKAVSNFVTARTIILWMIHPNSLSFKPIIIVESSNADEC
jgi:hypothetical protein